MCESQFKYTVNTQEFISKWLISDVMEVPFHAEPKPTVFPEYRPGVSVKDKDGKERVSPAKQEFLERGIFRKAGYPAEIVMDQLYYPFDTNRVDCSSFWSYPADITFYAKAEIEVCEDGFWDFRIFASGAVKVWVNGKLEAEFYPYESNIEQNREIRLYFCKGSNELVVGCNDYGERNIQFKFGLKNLGERLTVSLPVSVDANKLCRVNGVLNSLYMEKLSYQSGAVEFCSDRSFTEEMCLDIDVCGIHKQRMMHEGDSMIVWGDVSELPIGYHEFYIHTQVGQLEVGARLWAEVYPEKMITAAPAAYEERAGEVLKFAVEHSGPGMDRYIACLATGREGYAACEAAMKNELYLAEHRGDCADFVMFKVAWILKRYRDRIPEEFAAQLEKTVLGFRYWFDEPGNDAMWFFSENHALAFHTDELLAGELYPDRVFSNSGLTGKEHVEKAGKRIAEWFEKLFEYGYNEWYSASYIAVDMRSYITLYELTENEEIRRMAQKAMDYTYELYAGNSFDGVLGTSNGRTYSKDLLANHTMSCDSDIWLAWGCGYLNANVSPAMYVAMSDYRPPARLEAIARWEEDRKLLLKDTQGTFRVPTVLCKKKDYMLGSCVAPRTGYFGSQEHLLNIFLADAQTRIWINHPGEGKIFGLRRPGYFNGNGLTPLVEQQYNTAVMSYNFPDELLQRTEVNYVHAICDRSVCDEVLLQEKWLFIRRKTAFAAIYAENGLRLSYRQALKGIEFISDGVNGSWFIKVSDDREAGSFEAFREYLSANPPVIEGDRLYYKDFEYGDMQFSLMEDGYTWKVLNMPAAKELGLRSL